MRYIKKGYQHLLQRGRERIEEFIRENEVNYRTEKMCKVLEIPRSSYYKRRQEKPSKRRLENE